MMPRNACCRITCTVVGILIIKPSRCTNFSNLFLDATRKLSASLTVKNSDDGQMNYSKHVEFYSKNKFEKLVYLVGFITRTYQSARLPEIQKLLGRRVDLGRPSSSLPFGPLEP